MKIHSRLIIIGGLFSLAACTTNNPNGYTNYQTYTDHGIELYPQGYEDGPSEANLQMFKIRNQVSVPQTYYAGEGTPVRHDTVDKSWTAMQHANDYTIQIKEAEKPAEVAKTLLETPKEERTAQIKSENNGKVSYKGLYGSYPTIEAAEEAKKKLPASLQSEAQIITWSKVNPSRDR